MLYIVSTPIGNLSDMSYRAVETLKVVDLILCEDTRHSRRLLQHYEIDKPLRSYHKFNLKQRQEQILDQLAEGKSLALISDAGTPGISDPGSDIVAACIERELPVTQIPGPCALVSALVLSGLNTERFQFRGFLPKKSGQRERMLRESLDYPGSTVFYESPHRILKTLKQLEEIAPESSVVILRELTKKFEERLSGTAAELLAHWAERKPKGEFVLLMSGTA